MLVEVEVDMGIHLVEEVGRNTVADLMVGLAEYFHHLLVLEGH